MLGDPSGCNSIKPIFRIGDKSFSNKFSVHGNSCSDSLSGASSIAITPFSNLLGKRGRNRPRHYSCRVSCKSNLTGWFDTSFQINIALQHYFKVVMGNRNIYKYEHL